LAEIGNFAVALKISIINERDIAEQLVYPVGTAVKPSNLIGTQFLIKDGCKMYYIILSPSPILILKSQWPPHLR
jgi:hypothetical protein